MITAAYFHAYDARAHAVVLGFGGIALVCWQAAAMRDTRRLVWLFGLGAALVGALLTHGYAALLFVPLALGELARSIERRRIDGAVWITLVAASLAVLVSLPLLQDVKASFGTVFYAEWSLLPLWYQSYLGPAVFVLSVTLVLLCIAGLFEHAPGSTRSVGTLPSYELVVLLALIALPLLSFFLSRVTGAPFMNRYSISAIAGFAALVGLATAKRPAIGVAVLALSVMHIGIDLFQRVTSDFILEPSSGYKLSTHAAEVNKRYASMLAVKDTSLPIVLTDSVEFAPMFYYAPPAIAPRLVYLLRSKADVNGISYTKLRKCCNAPGSLISAKDFLSSHDRFITYGNRSSSWDPLLGADVQVQEVWGDDVLTIRRNNTPGLR